MKCSKCGYTLDRPGKFCPKCGNPMPQQPNSIPPQQQPTNQYQQPANMNNGGYIPPQAPNNIPPYTGASGYNNANPAYQGYQNAPKKKKSGGLIVLFIILGLFLLSAIGLPMYTSQKVYSEVVDYDYFRDDDTPLTIIVEPDDDDAECIVDITGLNNFIRNVDLDEMFSEVDYFEYEIKDMCFDTDYDLLYFLAQGSNGKYIDVTYKYEASFDYPNIEFTLDCIKLGEADASLAILKSGDFEMINLIYFELPADVALGIKDLDGTPDAQKVGRNEISLEYSNISTSATASTGDNGNNDSAPVSEYEDTWTVMIYMNGSTLEYDSGSNTYVARASEDIIEMMQSTLSDKVNIVIETGGTLQWFNDNINGDHNQRFEIKDGALNKISDLERLNMCDPHTLSSFADWAIKTYPAQNYALILWDHGGGSLQGFGHDEYFPQDVLTLSEIASSLNTVTTANNMKFELFGFDACLMGTVETANIIAPYANYYLASEESEPGHGWNYTNLVDIISMDSTVDGETLGTEIVYGFIGQAADEQSVDSITLSNIDLSQMAGVQKAFDNLVTLIIADATQNEQFKNNLLGTIPKLFEFSETDHYDLVGFAREMTKYYPSEANRLIEAIDKAVVANGAGYDRSTVGGLSFYIPYYDLYSYELFKDLYAGVAISDNYIQLCDLITTGKETAVSNNVTPEYTAQVDERPYTITFSEDYYINYLSSVYINVYMFYEDDTDYLLYDYGYDAWAGENDTPYTYEEDFRLWPCMFEYALSLEVQYADNTIIKYSAPIEVNGDDCDLLFTYYYDDASYHIDGYVYYQQNTDISDRTVYQFNEGDEVALAYYTYDFNTDEEYYTYTNPQVLTQENFVIEEYELATGDYALQFVIEDYTGQMHFIEEMGVFHFD